MERVDARAPVAKNARSGAPYQRGIGPHQEQVTISLVMAELAYPNAVENVRYLDGSSKKCDLVIGDEWAIEVKMIRMMGDNGKPNDNLVSHVISPYPKQRSALTDCRKLLDSGLPGHKAILMYGYEYPEFPLEPLVSAFEVLASREVDLGARVSASFDGLIHPVHQEGKVMAWELG